MQINMNAKYIAALITVPQTKFSCQKQKIVDTFAKRNGSKSTVVAKKKKNNRKIIFNFFLSLERKKKKISRKCLK